MFFTAMPVNVQSPKKLTINLLQETNHTLHVALTQVRMVLMAHATEKFYRFLTHSNRVCVPSKGGIHPSNVAHDQAYVSSEKNAHHPNEI